MSVGQAVGQVDYKIIGIFDGVEIPLITIKEAVKKNIYAERYIRYLCNVGQLIAIKINGSWFVDERLIKVSTLSAVQGE